MSDEERAPLRLVPETAEPMAMGALTSGPAPKDPRQIAYEAKRKAWKAIWPDREREDFHE